jgi:nucleoside-diphosphate-sugar epimerase
MKVCITGATGMVGKAVLLECLEAPEITSILLISRSSLGMEHPKLSELLLPHFEDLPQFKAQLVGYDACYHCMGVSVAGLNEESYLKYTFGYTKILADTLFEASPQAAFMYVSGAKTDSTEKGKIMWARVKGKTENYILNKGFEDAYAFRPGIIIPEKGVKSKTKLYSFFYFLFKPFYGFLLKNKNTTTSSKVGNAMIALTKHPISNKIIEASMINVLG